MSAGIVLPPGLADIGGGVESASSKGWTMNADTSGTEEEVFAVEHHVVKRDWAGLGTDPVYRNSFRDAK